MTTPIQGEVKSLYVAHKNRLCRFGFELVEQNADENLKL